MKESLGKKHNVHKNTRKNRKLLTPPRKTRGNKDIRDSEIVSTLKKWFSSWSVTFPAQSCQKFGVLFKDCTFKWQSSHLFTEIYCQCAVSSGFYCTAHEHYWAIVFIKCWKGNFSAIVQEHWYRSDKPQANQKEGPLSYVLLESSFASVSAGATPLWSLWV